MTAFIISAFTLAAALGWAVAGGMLWYLEYLTREDSQ
jgi:hypothetical protein